MYAGKNNRGMFRRERPEPKVQVLHAPEQKVQVPSGRKPTVGESPTTQDILTMQMCLNQNFCIFKQKHLHLQTGNQKFDHTSTMPHADRN